MPKNLPALIKRIKRVHDDPDVLAAVEWLEILISVDSWEGCFPKRSSAMREAAAAELLRRRK